ncbi:ParA family protein [Spiroplasma sp. hyd1]|uniref:ParA family protein n=1 Tax=Spiroplasma sp. hyd1 TaxID=1609976 RepID=UPI0018DAF9F6|nr:AAA family ATPase [Spiroplasma sp. hyd1]MBH8623225.1 hypothetical protein [Spiroplasma sp. hyd1]
MKIITIGALKGGVGKTNFTFNLSCFLAIEKKKRILVIDLDPQGNLTQCFQLETDKSYSMELFNINDKLENLVFKTDIENINIIPTNIQMAKLEIKLVNEISREKLLDIKFRQNYNYLEKNYDYILIDTNPSLNITNVNAYTIATNILLVCDNSIHSLRALNMTYELWEELCNKLFIKNRINAIIKNNFDHYKVSKDFKEYLEKSNLNKLVVQQEIRKKQVFKTSEITGIPVIKTLKNKENPYFNIVAELEQKGVI